MERQIIFRGKRLDNGEWVYGSLVSWNNGVRSILAPSSRPDLKPFQQELESHDVEPISVGQCTCLKDDLNNLIYEGDILEVNDDGKISTITCEYWHGAFGYRHNNYFYAFTENKKLMFHITGTDARVTVVGNIHD